VDTNFPDITKISAKFLGHKITCHVNLLSYRTSYFEEGSKYGGADKSLAPPPRKQATATKL